MSSRLRRIFLSVLSLALFLGCENELRGQVFVCPDTGLVTVAGKIMDENGVVDLSKLLARGYDADKLEIVGEQREALDDLIRKVGLENTIISAKLSEDPTNMAAQEAYRQAIAANSQQFNTFAEDYLLPIQISQLRNLAFQSDCSKVPFSKIFTNTALGSILELSDKEKAHMNKKAKEIEKELFAKIEQLRMEAREKLIMELPQDKRRILESKLGLNFEIKAEDVADPAR